MQVLEIIVVVYETSELQDWRDVGDVEGGLAGACDHPSFRPVQLSSE